MNIVKLNICIAIFLLYPFTATVSSQIAEPVDWKPPLPKLSEMNLDFKEIATLIGDDGQFIYQRHSRPVKCWTKGKVQEYTGGDGIIVTAMTIVHVPVEQVQNTILDCSLISDIQPQHTKVKVLSERENHKLYSFNQTYKMGFLTLNSDFLVQQTFEEDGSISILLHDGDVDAHVLMWECFSIDKNRSILALSFWSAYSTAKFSYKILMSMMAESEYCSPVSMSSMYLEQYSNYIDRDWISEHTDGQPIKANVELPIYLCQLSGNSRELIESLVTGGYVFIRSNQRAQIENETQSTPVVSTFAMLNVPFDKAGSFIADLDNYTDAISVVKSVKTIKQPKGESVRIHFRLGKFPILIPLFSEYTYMEKTENSFYFENRGKEKNGAYHPYAGVYEWDKMNNRYTNGVDATLYIYSHTLKIGPNANFYVRTLTRLMPDSENLQLVSSAIILVKQRIRWIENNYKTIF